MSHLLEVKDLHTSFNIPAGEVRSVNGVSFTLDKGQVLGIVGESGSGKSVTAYSIMQILQSPGRVIGGSILFNGKEMLNIPNKQLQKIRGGKVSIIFQDAMSSLNPVWSIGNQLKEAIKAHPNSNIYNEIRKLKEDAKNEYKEAIKNKKSKEEIKKLKDEYLKQKRKYNNFPHDRAIQMLELVGINSPEKRMKQYPFEFSGGMLQRIMIAMALSGEPDLIICDEPTTALDVTIQAQILELLKSIQKKMGMGIIIITHDLGVVAQICDYVNVMYAGRLVEKGTVRDIFYNPKHEYTKGLMNSIPKADVKVDRLEPIKGNPVDVFCLPTGCSFVPRCDKCMKVCLKKYPAYLKVDGEHYSACFNFAKELLDNKKISINEFNDYLNKCQEGNKAFNPITRLDVYKAYLNYKNKKEENIKKINSNKSLSKDEIDVLKYHIQDAKKEYNRAKRDFKLVLKGRKASGNEKLSIDKNDCRKKIKSLYKKIKSSGASIKRNQFDDMLNNLVISTTLPNEKIDKNFVLKLKEIKKQSFKNLFKKHKSLEDKVNCKHEHDVAVNNYRKAKNDLKWLKYINKKKAAVKKKLPVIYIHAVSKAIQSKGDSK